MPTTYAIPNGRTAMTATLYTGTGNIAVTRVNTDIGTTGFYPDLVWMKARSIAYSNILYDSVRGTGPNTSLVSDQIGAAGNNSTNCNLTAFTSTGFSTGITSGTNVLNASTQTYVAWQWNAGSGANVSNTTGSITSTVSANATAGFSVVKYTGTGANGTVGHGLGATPRLIILKNTTDTGGYNWRVWQTALSSTELLYLNTTDIKVTGATTTWNSTLPTSSVFSLGTNAGVNANGNGYVAYCWTAIPGFSAFGSYTGNGSSDGPFIYTGFRPKYVLVKNATGSLRNWYILDTSRDPYNVAYHELYTNVSDAEYTTDTTVMDFLSNGFKIRGSYVFLNESSQTIIYAAFAENPFKYANAR